PTPSGFSPRDLPTTSPARCCTSTAASKWNDEGGKMAEQAMAEAINKQDIDAVFPKVAQIIADALGCEVGDVKPKASLIEDLDAESIDFLDLVFRLHAGCGG